MFKDKFKEQLDTLTPTSNKLDYQAEKISLINKEISCGFAEWIIQKHKQYPDSVLRYDRLFDIYEKEQSGKLKTMLLPKQKANELYLEVSKLIDLTHSEILEVLDFLIETKLISPKIKPNELSYWEEVKNESKNLKP